MGDIPEEGGVGSNLFCFLSLGGVSPLMGDPPFPPVGVEAECKRGLRSLEPGDSMPGEDLLPGMDWWFWARIFRWWTGLLFGICLFKLPRVLARARAGDGVRRRDITGEAIAIRTCGEMEGGEGDRESEKEERLLSDLGAMSSSSLCAGEEVADNGLLAWWWEAYRETLMLLSSLVELVISDVIPLLGV